MVMRRCEDHRFVDAWDLPKVAKGADFKVRPPKIVPMSLVDLLNDVCAVLRTVSHGTRPFVQVSWLGKGNWQIELSGTNNLASETGPVGRMIESPDHFMSAVRQANDFLNADQPNGPTDRWELMKVLEEDFEPTFSWATKPGTAGADGAARGVTLILNCTTKPEVSFEYGIPYWEQLIEG